MEEVKATAKVISTSRPLSPKADLLMGGWRGKKNTLPAKQQVRFEPGTLVHSRMAKGHSVRSKVTTSTVFQMLSSTTTSGSCVLRCAGVFQGGEDRPVSALGGGGQCLS